jgi:hypothetical protein
MALQFSDTLRNNRINQFETTIGISPHLYIRSGLPPANCAAADTGLMLCDITLPSDWLTSAALGNKTKIGTWQANADPAAGTGTLAGHFRLKSGVTTHCQGTVTLIGGGGNMTIDDLNIIAGQPVNVTSFSITDGNA